MNGDLGDFFPGQKVLGLLRVAHLCRCCQWVERDSKTSGVSDKLAPLKQSSIQVTPRQSHFKEDRLLWSSTDREKPHAVGFRFEDGSLVLSLERP
jgi:hypothetical protein